MRTGFCRFLTFFTLFFSSAAFSNDERPMSFGVEQDNGGVFEQLGQSSCLAGVGYVLDWFFSSKKDEDQPPVHKNVSHYGNEFDQSPFDLLDYEYFYNDENYREWLGLSPYQRKYAPYVVDEVSHQIYSHPPGEIVRSFAQELGDFLTDEEMSVNVRWNSLQASKVTLNHLEGEIRESYKFRKKKVKPLEKKFGKGYINEKISEYRASIDKQIERERDFWSKSEVQDFKERCLRRSEIKTTLGGRGDCTGADFITLPNEEKERLLSIVRGDRKDPVHATCYNQKHGHGRSRRWSEVKKLVSLRKKFLSDLLNDHITSHSDGDLIVRKKVYERLKAVERSIKSSGRTKKTYEVSPWRDLDDPFYERLVYCRGNHVQQNIHGEVVEVCSRNLRGPPEGGVAVAALGEVALTLNEKKEYERAYSVVDFCTAFCDAAFMPIRILTKSTICAAEKLSDTAQRILDNACDFFMGLGEGASALGVPCPCCGIKTTGLACDTCMSEKGMHEIARAHVQQATENLRAVATNISTFVQNFRDSPEETTIEFLATSMEKIAHIGIWSAAGAHVTTLVESASLTAGMAAEGLGGVGDGGYTVNLDGTMALEAAESTGVVGVAAEAAGQAVAVEGAMLMSGGETGDSPVFASPEKLSKHFKKHKKEFGDITKAEYLSRAQELVCSSPGENVLIKIRSNGDMLFYNKSTGEFAVRSAEGFIRTLFRPVDGLDYFLKQ